ncbi:hypothetical protein SBD_6927 [Streptomyces bottropensis ATCC 25435]|uniref:Uncharacterized protein n=1 Tax=Streptomyces bottropensis ATCC 25435 TaxID=1054862 RepID=M3FGV8_9ACTN|nr:hypothetical protein SBD_6927 [Streptomyces bottropensis ATCC 25435]
MLGRRVSKSSGRHGQEGAPVVAVRYAGRPPPELIRRGCLRCGSGVPRATFFDWGAHRSTGYQGISDRTRSLPATLRARADTELLRQSVNLGRPPPLAHPFGPLVLPGAARGALRRVVSSSDTRCRARPARRHHPSPSPAITRVRQSVEQRSPPMR